MATTGRSNSQILQELEALSKSLFQPRTRADARRTTSFDLPRNGTLLIPIIDDKNKQTTRKERPRSRRMSMSSLPNSEWKENEEENVSAQHQRKNIKWGDEQSASSGKKGIWKWKPIRALTHLAMQKLSCLFTVEVIVVKNLPASMDGLRLAVCVRKKESKDGSVQTMPSRVSQGAADFDETLFIRCHVYFTPGSGIHMKFESRPFQISVLAVDAEELDFGKSFVDLSSLIQESIKSSFDGKRIRQWDRIFSLSGKAKGGELVLKLGFQIMEKDGGIRIYNEAEEKLAKSRTYSSSFARKQSKLSFSIPSTRMPGRSDHETDSQATMDDDDLPDFEVVDRGVEIEDKNRQGEEKRSGEIVKDVVQDQSHLIRLKELDSIAQQIKALESAVEEKEFKSDEETGSQTLDAEDDKLTREFLQMLDDPQGDNVLMTNENVCKQKVGNEKDEEEVYVPDLGKGLGCIVQTRNGGYLAAANPFETPVARKDEPKLAIQMSKPLVIRSNMDGFGLLQKMAAMGFEELTSEISALMPMDELTGKTAEQIAFEGIASAIIHGRKKEGASSSAARTIDAVKSMVAAMNGRRKGFGGDAMTVDEILAMSLPKMETMAVDALKVQAGIAEEGAPFDDGKNVKVYANLLGSAVPVEDWIKMSNANHADDSGITIFVIIQLRDPLRQYEVVGGHMIAMIHAMSVTDKFEEKRYKVRSNQVGGIKVRTLRAKSVWDGEKQKLTALQWLVGNGIEKGGKKVKVVVPIGPDWVWSMSSRVAGDVWLKSVRNPNVKFSK